MAAATGWRSRPTGRSVRADARRARIGRSSTRSAATSVRAIMTEIRRAQYDLRARRPPRLSRRTQIAAAHVADPATHTVVQQVGPFSDVDPAVHDQRRADPVLRERQRAAWIRSRRSQDREETAPRRSQGYSKGPVKRHGCPSHGVALTPDERELWLADGANSAIHIFDARVMPPKQVASIKVRDQPGWITFSMDGRHACPPRAK